MKAVLFEHWPAAELPPLWRGKIVTMRRPARCNCDDNKRQGSDAMTAEQVLIDKIKQLPPQRMAEVEDFVDFLRAREDDLRLAHGATKASEASFAAVWDNDEDAAYDRM